MFKKVFISILAVLILTSCFGNNTEKQKNSGKKLDNDNNGVIVSEVKVEKKGIGGNGQISTYNVETTNSPFKK